MQEVTLKVLKQKALEAQSLEERWHYHFMSPACTLNSSDKFALVFENLTTDEQCVYRSDQAEIATSKELALLVHGPTVMNDVSLVSVSDFDEDTRKIIMLADELSKKSVDWHHHVLFPGCMFNMNDPKYTLMLENPVDNNSVYATSDSEPKDALSYIEKLFYKS